MIKCDNCNEDTQIDCKPDCYDLGLCEWGEDRILLTGVDKTGNRIRDGYLLRIDFKRHTFHIIDSFNPGSTKWKFE